MHEYRVAAVDQASNRAETKVEITATGALFSPLPGAVASPWPTLAWASVKRAAYYNVLLMRGRKIFSAWPGRTSFRLPKTCGGTRGAATGCVPACTAGTSSPASITAGKYGRLLGGSTFVYRP